MKSLALGEPLGQRRWRLFGGRRRRRRVSSPMPGRQGGGRMAVGGDGESLGLTASYYSQDI